MAKKRFNISSTLNKNQESKLAEKIPLRKNTKDLEEVKEKVEQIHPERQQKTETKGAKSSQKKVSEVEEKEKLVRMTIDTPESIHKKLKIRSVEKGISLRDYILKLIEKELK